MKRLRFSVGKLNLDTKTGRKMKFKVTVYKISNVEVDMINVI